MITSEISYINIFNCNASMGSIGNGSPGGSSDLLSCHNDTGFLTHTSTVHCALPHICSVVEVPGI